MRVWDLGFGVEGLWLIDSCITRLKAQGPSRTCNESKEAEEDVYLYSEPLSVLAALGVPGPELVAVADQNVSAKPPRFVSASNLMCVHVRFGVSVRSTGAV